MAARDSVLVTGAYGLVGRPTVERLVADGFEVIATAHHTTKPALPAAVDVRSVDLTEPAQIKALIADVSPSAIVHLAAVIPPQCYARPAHARKVNVDATAALVRAAEELASPPRFVHASSVAVHGSRNPHRYTDLLTPTLRWRRRTCTAATRVRPKTSCDRRIWNGRSSGSAA